MNTATETGQFFSYKMRLRPFGMGCQPPGHVRYVDADKRKDGYWGIVTYGRKLTDAEVKQYELTYLDLDATP